MSKAKCSACDGDGTEADYVGLEMNPVETSCSVCGGFGTITVGDYANVCARHCHLCEGQDHHWSYDGAQDDAGEPLMGCRHCSALRLFTQDDDANAEY